MSLLARALAPRSIKAIDQQTDAQYPGGYYVRIDDRSTLSQTLYDANTSALSMSTVYACVRVLAEDIAKLPFVVYRKLPNGGKARAFDHPLYSVLHDEVHPGMTSFVWRELVMSHLATWGNHYSEKVYDAMGRLQLWPIRPDRMEVKYDSQGRKTYTYLHPNGTRQEMQPGSVFHIAGLSSNGLVGLSPIALHAKTLRLAETAQEFGQNFLGNNARPATVLTHPNNLSVGAITRLASQMDQMKGSRNSGKTVVLEEGLTITEVGVPPEDAQYIETRKFQRNIIATEIFRMKPHKVGDLEHATFSNIEHESLDHVIDTLMPWAVRIEQETKAQLLFGEREITAELLFDALLRGDAKSRAEALAIRWQHGTLTPDEWRALENENPLPDGLGNQTYVPVNYAPALAPGSEPLQLEAKPIELPLLGAGKSSEVRCDKGHLLAEVATPPYLFTCGKCKTTKSAGLDDQPDPMKSLLDRFDERLESLPGDIAAAMPSNRQEPPEVHFHEGAFRGEAPIVNLPAPVVNVEAAKAPVVNVPTGSFVEAIRDLKEMLAAPKTRRIERDEHGRITGLVEG